VSFPNIVATGKDAEKLLKYLLAYRTHMGAIQIDSKQEKQFEDNVTMGVVPLEEAMVVAGIRKK